MISVDLLPVWYPKCTTCNFPQNRTEMHFFSKNPKIDLRMCPIEKSLLGIESPYLWPLFKPMLISKKNLKVMALKMLFFRFCVFEAKSCIWFCGNGCSIAKSCENVILIYITHLKSIVLNKFSLWYIWFWDDLTLTSQCIDISAYRQPSTRMEWWF